jgi:hypothetical protein
MSKETPVFEFEEDSLYGEVFGFADIPESWRDGDFISELNRSDVLVALNKSADYVDEDVFDDGGFGTCGAYYKVYANDVNAFKKNSPANSFFCLKTPTEKMAIRKVKTKPDLFNHETRKATIHHHELVGTLQPRGLAAR